MIESGRWRQAIEHRPAQANNTLAALRAEIQINNTIPPGSKPGSPQNLRILMGSYSPDPPGTPRGEGWPRTKWKLVLRTAKTRSSQSSACLKGTSLIITRSIAIVVLLPRLALRGPSWPLRARQPVCEGQSRPRSTPKVPQTRGRLGFASSLGEGGGGIIQL